MPPMSLRMPAEAPRYELANLLMLIFIDQNCFETETLRPKASNHGGQEGRQPMSPRMPLGGYDAPTAHRHQHLLEALGR